ncbi:MAG: hypothetical protein ACOC0Z_00250 [Halohasta sp.]
MGTENDSSRLSRRLFVTLGGITVVGYAARPVGTDSTVAAADEPVDGGYGRRPYGTAYGG